MGSPVASLEREVAALRAVWAEAMPAFTAIPGEAQPGGVQPGGVQIEVEQLGDAGLVRVTDALARLRREVDGLLVRVAAEVARRSGPELGDQGLAKAHGFHNPVRLLAAATGGSRAEAARLVAVGAATAERASFTGERAPARHPHVAAALGSAAISLDAAAAITSMLDRVAVRADPALADTAEAALVRLAGQVPLEVVLRGVREAEARLDADGVQPREEQLRANRSLTMRQDGAGMLHLHARLDPAAAAPVKAVIDALVTDALRRRERAVGRGAGRPGPGAAAGLIAHAHGDDDRPGHPAAETEHHGPVLDDQRTIPQIQADALADLARHALGCTDAPTPLAKTTVVVRVDLETLVTGLGNARIDGLDQPISGGTARRMAADAELIPAVLGGESLPLDLGRAARLFTKAQRLALGERDGGCACCGQNIGYVEAHHIDWWERDTGPTDLANGVLLCSFCHHLIHRDGWIIRATANSIWFIPPPHIDPDQTPRLGGRARFEVAITDVAA